MLVLMFLSGKQTVSNYKIILIKWKRAFHQVKKSKTMEKLKYEGECGTLLTNIWFIPLKIFLKVSKVLFRQNAILLL